MTRAKDVQDKEVAAVGAHAARLTDETVAGVTSLARSLGFLVFEVDLAGCHEKADLLAATARVLAFPAWFGHNWDAWFDCLTDLSWQPPATGYVLLLRRAAQLQQSSPEVLDTALAIVEDAARVWAARGATLRAFVDTAD